MSWLTLRCPRCGAYLAAPSPATGTSWATCPHCYAVLPVVAARDPPPLFTWEVYPAVYPALPPPRAPGRQLPTVVVVALVLATVLLAGLAGLTAFTGVSALAPATFSMSGTVVGAPAGTLRGPLPSPPVAGALATLTGEGGYEASVVTGPSGTFSFTGIPAGGATLNVTDRGYAPTVVNVFFSKPYTAAGAPGGLTVTLTPSPAPASTVVVTPFANLESLLTSLFSATVLLGVAGAVSAAGALGARHGRRPALGVAGGAAAIVAPVALFLLGDTTVLPWTAYATAGLSAIGAVAASLGTVPLLWEGPPPEPVEPD